MPNLELKHRTKPQPTGNLAAPFAPDPDPDFPRIYVACLAAYNNGHLYSSWIDVDDEDSI